jgi:hypothetical protein
MPSVRTIPTPPKSTSRSVIPHQDLVHFSRSHVFLHSTQCYLFPSFSTFENKTGGPFVSRCDVQLAHPALGSISNPRSRTLTFPASIAPNLDAEDPASPTSNFLCQSRTTLTSKISFHCIPRGSRRRLLTPFCRFTTLWSRKLSIWRKHSAG